MWPVLGVIRSSTVDQMAGGINGLYAKLLEICFLDGEHTMMNGVQLVCNQEAFSVTFKYGGLLADEDCLEKGTRLQRCSGGKALYGLWQHDDDDGDANRCLLRVLNCQCLMRVPTCHCPL